MMQKTWMLGFLGY